MKWLAMTVALSCAASATAQEEDSLRITLLGTGNPRPTMQRFGPSILVEAGEATVLIDAGRGAIQRLFQIGEAPQVREVDAVAFTHLHSDHVVGFPDFWLTSWVFGRDRPLEVYGPPGTESMCEHLEKAFAFDKKARSGQEAYSQEGILLEVKDVSPGAFYEHDGLKLTAFTVDHGEPIAPAYGYRVDYHGYSAAFSGDTRYYEPIVEQAKGVDVLVHEVISPEVEFRTAQVVGPDAVARVIAHHASPEQVGEIFARVKPRLAVYSHIVPSPALADDLIPPTRKTYDGPLAVGYDLMTIVIGERVEFYPRRIVSHE